MGTKVGLMTREESNFLAKVIADEIPVNGVYQMAIKYVLPILFNSIDDRIGDKLPEPWQTYTEELITGIYTALQDKVLTEEELDVLIDKVANVLNAEVNLPLLEENDEVVVFMYLLKFIAAQLKVILKKKV